MSSKPLRPYQEHGVSDIRRALAKTRRVIYQLDTGGGKTRVMAEIVRLARDKGSRVVLLAPRRELVYQIRDSLAGEGVAAGIIMAGEHQAMMSPVYVCSFDTLHARAIQRDTIELPDADIVIVDEAHLAVADGRQAILNAYDKQRHVLFTATPARGDGRGLCEIADEIVFGPTRRELIDAGHLLPLRYFAPTEPDLAGLKLNREGDYQEGALAKLMDKPKLIGDIVDNWERLARDRSTVVFCVRRSHSRHVCEEFKRRGYTAEHLDGETDKEERKAILARVSSGETQVLCNVFVASYGLDIPRLSCCVIARPTKNIVLYLQTTGRVARPFEDQVDGIVIDHAGAIKENGYAEDHHPWSLDGKEKIKDRMLKEKQSAGESKELVCTECGAAFRARRTCPHCGAQIIPITEAIPVHAADLVELKRKETAAEKANRTTPTEEKRRFFGELRQFAADHGKADGWVAHTYRAKFGVFPNAHRDAPPRPVSESTASFIKHRNIAFARRRA